MISSLKRERKGRDEAYFLKVHGWPYYAWEGKNDLFFSWPIGNSDSPERKKIFDIAKAKFKWTLRSTGIIYNLHVNSSVLQVTVRGRLAILDNNILKEKKKWLHFQVLCPRLAIRRNNINTGFEFFEILKLLGQFSLSSNAALSPPTAYWERTRQPGFLGVWVEELPWLSKALLHRHPTWLRSSLLSSSPVCNLAVTCRHTRHCADYGSET